MSACPFVDRECVEARCHAWTESRGCTLVETWERGRHDCGSCRAWVPDNADEVFGQCHADTPVRLADGVSGWPETECGDWCARWR